MDKTELKFFNLAKAASKFSDWKRQHIGAVITYKGRPIEIGYNTEKELPMQKKYNMYRGFDPNTSKNCAHAEMVALSRLVKNKSFASLDITKIHIYVYREYKNGRYALAKPCAACEAAIRSVGIKHVHYTGNDSLIYERYY